MNMKTQNEISLLADQELDAVVGGRINLPHLDRPHISGSNQGRINDHSGEILAGTVAGVILVSAVVGSIIGAFL
jgi:hypothetical protein